MAGHGEGCTLDQAMDGLSVLAATEGFAGVSVAQLNPDHGDAELATLKRFSGALARAQSARAAIMVSDEQSTGFGFQECRQRDVFLF